MTCDKIVIVYERHDQPQATKTVVDLMHLFKKYDINSLCLEEPNDMTFQDQTLKYQKSIEGYENCLSDMSLSSPCVQNLLRHIKLDVTTLSPSKQKILLNESQYFFSSTLETTKQNFELMTKVSQYNFSYCAMDLPKDERYEFELKNYKALDGYDIRNAYMKDKILEQCDKNGNVLLIVGASHFKLAKLLQNEGVKHIYEYYIVNSPEGKGDMDIAENCLRRGDHSHIDYCKNYHFNGMLVDLYKNPSLNATYWVGHHFMINEVSPTDWVGHFMINEVSNDGL